MVEALALRNVGKLGLKEAQDTFGIISTVNFPQKLYGNPGLPNREEPQQIEPHKTTMSLGSHNQEGSGKPVGQQVENNHLAVHNKNPDRFFGPVWEAPKRNSNEPLVIPQFRTIHSLQAGMPEKNFAFRFITLIWFVLTSHYVWLKRSLEWPAHTLTVSIPCSIFDKWDAPAISKARLNVYNFILAAETWLSPSASTNDMTLVSYSIFRKDRLLHPVEDSLCK